jgi:hypothetical protein
MLPKPGVPLKSVVTVSFTELFGRTPTLDLAKDVLRRYQRRAVLVMLGKLGAVLKTWQLRPDFSADPDLARRVFRDAGKPEYQSIRDDVQRAFFPRVAILATARLALEVCEAEGEPTDTPRSAAAVLQVCMMMNELVAPGNPSGTLEFVAHHLPYHNGFIQYRFQADIVRSMALFAESETGVQGSAGETNLGQEFERAIGIKPLRFAEFALLVGTIYLSITGASFTVDDSALFLRREHFASTNLTAAEINSFLAAVARNDEELAAEFRSRPARPLADTTVFQSYPLIQLPGDQYFCLDVAALLDKAGRGLYWTIARGRAHELGGSYGKLFESYLQDIVEQSSVPQSRYIPNPKFTDGAEVCDGLFAEGSQLILCEYKSSVLPASAKVGADSALLRQKLDRSFVTGDQGGRKGTAQISRSIERILMADMIIGLPNRPWTKIYSVMVCLDSAMTCPGMAAYLNEQFVRPRVRGRKVIIPPITIIDVEDYEALMPDIAKYAFTAILDSYYFACARGELRQVVRFHRRNIPFLSDKPKPSDSTETNFRQMLADMGPRVFAI